MARCIKSKNSPILPQISQFGNPHFIFPLAKFDDMIYGRFMPERKLDILRQRMAAGDWSAALSLAAKFPRLGEHKAAITRAHGAIMNPGF